MKKIALLSHCVLNSYCEMPAASDTFRRKIMEILVAKKIGIVQLPCPELCFQALERESILPDSAQAGEYKDYCKKMLEPVFKNLTEYRDHGIQVAGIVGIDTSPSCSVLDKQAIMTDILIREMDERKIEGYGLIDMPVSGDGESFFKKLNQW